MSKVHHLVGDVVVVQHLNNNIKSDSIVIPETVRPRIAAIEAEVIDWGIVPPERRKHGKNKDKNFFVCDIFALHAFKGDIRVLVPAHLGTRGLFPEYPNFILYDGEDILAIIEK